MLSVGLTRTGLGTCSSDNGSRLPSLIATSAVGGHDIPEIAPEFTAPVNCGSGGGWLTEHISESSRSLSE